MSLTPDFRILTAYYAAAILLPLSLIAAGWTIDHVGHIVDSNAHPCRQIDWNATGDSCQSKLTRVAGGIFFVFAIGQLFVWIIVLSKNGDD